MKKLGWKELERINGSSPTRLPIPSSCKNFSYTFQLKLPERKERKSRKKSTVGGGDENATKKRANKKT